jgi:GntR family histidine utilization transcriptional repressor
MTEVAEKRALHERIGSELTARIRSGEWPPGHRIPFEHELMRQYDCARGTVNKVVQSLAAAGLVERRRRAGTFVIRPRIQSAVLEIPDIEAEITRRGQAYGYELIASRVHAADVDDADAALMGPCTRVMAVQCRHFADSRPFAYEDRVINLDTTPQAAAADFTRQGPGAWLRVHVAWTQARHQISAINPETDVARKLDLKATTACLCLKRWTWKAGAGVTFVRQVFPGDAYDLVATFSPGAD